MRLAWDAMACSGKEYAFQRFRQAIRGCSSLDHRLHCEPAVQTVEPIFNAAQGLNGAFLGQWFCRVECRSANTTVRLFLQCVRFDDH